MLWIPANLIGRLPIFPLRRIWKGSLPIEVRQYSQVERRYECASRSHGASRARSTGSAENHLNSSALGLQQYSPVLRPPRDAIDSSIQKVPPWGIPLRSCKPIQPGPSPFAMRGDRCNFAPACQTLIAVGSELMKLLADATCLLPSSNCLLPTAYSQIGSPRKRATS
jgi:hypothetical protein